MENEYGDLLAKISEIGASLNGLNDRFNHLENQFEGSIEKIHDIDIVINNLDHTMSRLNVMIDNHENRLKDIETESGKTFKSLKNTAVVVILTLILNTVGQKILLFF